MPCSRRDSWIAASPPPFESFSLVTQALPNPSSIQTLSLCHQDTGTTTWGPNPSSIQTLSLCHQDTGTTTWGTTTWAPQLGHHNLGVQVLYGPPRGESCPIIDSMSLAPLPLLALIRADTGAANDGHPAKAIHVALFERLFMDAQAREPRPVRQLPLMKRFIPARATLLGNGNPCVVVAFTSWR
jgi:hypothetical protein